MWVGVDRLAPLNDGGTIRNRRWRKRYGQDYVNDMAECVGLIEFRERWTTELGYHRERGLQQQ